MHHSRKNIIARSARVHPALLLAYALFVSVLVITGVIWSLQLDRDIQDSYRRLTHTAEKIALAQAMQNAITRRLAYLYAAFSSDDPFEQDSLVMAFYHQAGIYRQARDRLMALMDTEEERAMLDELNRLVRESQAVTDRVPDLLMGGASRERITRALKVASEKQRPLIRQLSALVELEQQLNERTIALGTERLQGFRRFSLVIGLVILLASSVLVWLARRVILRRQHMMTLQAMTDPLTGLPNRRAMLELIGEAIIDARRHGRRHVLLYLDLDRFKPVNDHCGHAAGDRVLCRLAEAWGQRLRGSDVLGRMGGDEFVAVLHEVDMMDARKVADDLMQLTRAQRFRCAGREFQLSVSIGLAPIDGRIPEVGLVLRHADQACYRAKRARTEADEITGALSA